MSAINSDYLVEAQPSELELFNLNPTQTAVEKIYFQQILPIGQITDTSPIQFVVSGQNGMEYIDTRRSFMSIKARIVHSDGSALGDDEYVGPVNLLAHALFEQVDVTIQGKFITSSTGNYPYKAYIQTLLNYGVDAKSSQLTSQCYYKDTPGHLDDNDGKTGANAGFKLRSALFSKSKKVHMIAPIMHDAFQLDRYILNQTAMNIKFYRAKPEFYLTTDSITPNFKVVIDEMVLNMCKVQVNPAVVFCHSQKLQKTNAKYPYVKTEVRLAAISQGQVNFNIDNVCQGIRPNKIIVAFANSQSVSGSYKSSPWNFQGFGLTELTVSVDNIPVLGNPMRLNFDAKSGTDTAEAFHWMFETTGKWLKNEGNDLSQSDIAKGFAVYSFNIEPTYNDRNFLTLVKQGIVRVSANFANPLPTPVTCIVYTEGVGYFEVNQARDVIVYQ
ncbi:hypothetical protein ACF0H5_017279 [Mactra antiquata]